jgi:hypothetical protein
MNKEQTRKIADAAIKNRLNKEMPSIYQEIKKAASAGFCEVSYDIPNSPEKLSKRIVGELVDKGYRAVSQRDLIRIFW